MLKFLAVASLTATLVASLPSLNHHMKDGALAPILGNNDELPEPEGNYTIPNSDNAMYNAGLFGGDMAGGLGISDTDEERTALIESSSWGIWPNRRVYFQIHSSSAAVRSTIINAMNQISAQTCIRFTEGRGSFLIRSYILIRGDQAGCWSYVGRYKRGGQTLNLQNNGCVYKGIIMHELLHAIGFFHEHQRYDRNNYVSIQLQNVEAGRESNFNIVPLTQSRQFGVPYDFASVMHYGLTSFSKNGLRTMVPIGAYANVDPGEVWNKNFLAASDAKEINKLYGC